MSTKDLENTKSVSTSTECKARGKRTMRRWAVAELFDLFLRLFCDLGDLCSFVVLGNRFQCFNRLGLVPLFRFFLCIIDQRLALVKNLFHRGFGFFDRFVEVWNIDIDE